MPAPQSLTRGQSGWLVLGLAIGLLAASQHSAAFAQALPEAPSWNEETETVYLEGLRRRRLYRLAEQYCRRQLERAYPATDRNRIAVELLRILAERAIHAPLTAQQEAWKEAHAFADAHLAAQPAGSPGAELVQFQAGLTFLAEGELLWRESRRGGDTQTQRRAAFEAISQGDRQLAQLDELLVKEIPRRRGQSEAGLTGEQLFALQNNVWRQRARAQRLRALCFPPNSDDRLASLVDALEQIKRSLTQVTPDQPLIWEIRLEHARCLRLLGREEEAERAIAQLMVREAPPRAQLEGRAEAARLELGRGAPRQALQHVTAQRQLQGVDSPELDLAAVQTLVALWREAAGESDAAQKWRGKAIALADFMRQHHGEYWGRLADRELVQGTLAGGGSRDMELLRRQAEGYYVAGKLQDALAAYDRAAQEAAAAKRNEAAFELAYQAALVAKQLQLAGEYLDRLRQVAAQHRQDRRAARAHLQAIVASLALVKQDPGNLALYRELLEEHLEWFPEQPSASQVASWLGKLRESQRQWPAAREAYLRVPADSPQFGEALRGIGRCWNRQLAALPSTEPASRRAALREQALQWLAGIVDSQALPPQPESDVQRDAAVIAAQLLLRSAPQRPRPAAALLRFALQTADASQPPNASWFSQPLATEARALLAVASVATGDPAAATAQLAAFRDLPAHAQLAILELLADQLTQTPPDQRADVSQLIQSLAAQLPHEQLEPRQRGELERMIVDALAAAGKRDEALAKIDGLLEQSPRDGQLHRRRAELLSQSSDPQQLRQALAQWRVVARGHRPRSAEWFRAKLEVARMLMKLGDNEQARQFIRYLQATSDLKASGLEPEFLELLRKTG